MTGPKGTVYLGGYSIAATSSVTWRLQAGTQPFSTVYTVHNRVWETAFKSRMGEPLKLEFTDRSRRITIKGVYILHAYPSDSPHRTSFVVADVRWKWPYRLVARDYNVPRKTGDRTVLAKVPSGNQTVIDKYDFRRYSLKESGDRWTAQDAVEDVLDIIYDGDGDGYSIDSFPIKENGAAGQFTLQNVTLRDQGDRALARLLTYIPAAQIYIGTDGKAHVYDGADYEAAEKLLTEGLPVATRDGEKPEVIDRSKIRPSKVEVFYEREVEVVLEFSDNYSGNTTSTPGRSSPFLENVIPTIDPETDVTIRDPEEGAVTVSVPPGVYIEASEWLAAYDEIKPEDSQPWTFDTIREGWVSGKLDPLLGAGGVELDGTGDVSMRIQALKEHFRQTFRINRRFTDRARDMKAWRAMVLDPVSGARAPAGVWGQVCVIPTDKSAIQSGRKGDEQVWVYRNVDHYPKGEQSVSKVPPGPQELVFRDRALGVFRLQTLGSPFGLYTSLVPCMMVNENETNAVPTRDMSLQDEAPLGPGIRTEGGSNGLFISKTLDLKVMVTMVPAAPNSTRRFHKETVSASDVSKMFKSEYRIQGGTGPVLQVYVPPGEMTARFAWEKDSEASATVSKLFGLDSDDPNSAGIDGNDLPGFITANLQRGIPDHAQAVAAEALSAFADGRQGSVATRIPAAGLKLVGNMTASSVTASTSGKVSTMHEFPGAGIQVSRVALLPESVRYVIFGTPPFEADK